MTKSTHPNQGISNAYYDFAPTADWFGLGRWTREVPLPLFWLAPLLTVGLAAAERVMHRDVSAFPGPRLAALGLVAIAAGAMPVLFTTASGPETQAFVLVYFLAAGVMADAIWRAVRDARAFVRDAARTEGTQMRSPSRRASRRRTGRLPSRNVAPRLPSLHEHEHLASRGRSDRARVREVTARGGLSAHTPVPGGTEHH